MKHILLSILMVFAIGFSIPSATTVKIDDKQVEFDYEMSFNISECCS